MTVQKPMAVSIGDCVAIVEAVRRAGVMLAVCHVLRYTPYQQKIQEVLASVRQLAQVALCLRALHTLPDAVGAIRCPLYLYTHLA
jgi:hypothetical protein